ncbi:hypothetical protein ANCDUO_09647 [Ancylostoma duodenale]|uniref:Retrotransposon gag protein n=1 Tax=Ancylostoma duodenale TaxID=51022 RepID=A0A0C2CTA4_9BILA|nr:hypothetical protein ANCDUO_09647 [Ancylostoma duodenale]
MRTVTLTSEQKANFLIGFLDGIAREKIEEMTPDDRKNYDLAVAHLKSYFEGPQQRYMARQLLATCRQEIGESAALFANRVLNLVRAATSGQDPATQKERVLEEFVARLRPDTRYYVKLEGPVTFEQAVNKAQMVEQLLAEATADCLIHPASTIQTHHSGWCPYTKCTSGHVMATTELSSSTTSTIAVSQPPPVAQQSVRADDLLASDSEMQSLCTPYYDFEGWEKDRNKRGARFIKWGGVEDMKYGVSEEEELLKEKNL